MPHSEQYPRRVIWLTVPYAQKDAAKALGARWEPAKRQWWIFADAADRSPFAEWVGAPVDPKQRQPRRKLVSELDRRWADAMARDD